MPSWVDDLSPVSASIDWGEGFGVHGLDWRSPEVVVVLTDGYTPWPLHPPKSVEVVVGLIGTAVREAPDWARVVRIEDVA